ncbi:ABC transporter ATP-binding/permease protein YojI [Acaryochloris thomasi RCC1774]|uniref:ABC transporter ATP-binding/permease protein YojI n=1 Tax=Acaryochloris thomasi RCC1774 TaxID=1764569 RepID=A0A2W1K526_9CYAN|nr:cyclic peptide export ABC transporter [Acaryochloris thomasi]PZD75041.1 ABC transporter ATP-binding/permease protein YojI [Acaryochloris thomasi RCC1774]
MKLIHLLLKNSWRAVTLSTLTGILGGGSTAGLVAAINFTLQRLDQIPGWLPWVFLGLCLMLLVSGAYSQIYIAKLSQDIIYQLRLELAQSVLDCPLQHLEQLGAPKLLATLTDDIGQIANASAFTAQLSLNLAWLLGSLFYLCWLSPSLFMMFLIFMVVSITIYQKLLDLAQASLKSAFQVRDHLFENFETLTTGTKELKLHQQRRRDFFQSDLEPTASKLGHHWIQALTIYSWTGSLGLVLFLIPIGFLMYVLPYWITLDQRTLAGYALTILFMLSPIRAILNILPEIAKANVALAKVDSLGLALATPSTENQLTKATPKPGWTSLKFVDLEHTYPSDREDHRFTLGPLNLKFTPGEIVFIVGGNGSGKSTLVKLITGLYQPEAGHIEWDGEPVDDRNREQYRQQFSAIFADFYLFDRLLGIETEALKDQAQSYLTQLELDHKVTIEGNTLSTLNLSQGQRKRLALLTAYLEDRPIYVFDEWASDQDPVFKKVFYTQLVPALKQRGKTVLVVSHDDRYFESCDRTIKLDYGQVVSVQES